MSTATKSHRSIRRVQTDATQPHRATYIRQLHAVEGLSGRVILWGAVPVSRVEPTALQLQEDDRVLVEYGRGELHHATVVAVREQTAVVRTGWVGNHPILRVFPRSVARFDPQTVDPLLDLTDSWAY